MDHIYCFRNQDARLPNPAASYIFIGDMKKYMAPFLEIIGLEGCFIVCDPQFYKNFTPTFMVSGAGRMGMVQYSAIERMLNESMIVEIEGWDLDSIITLSNFMSLKMKRPIGFKNSEEFADGYCLVSGPRSAV